MLDRFDACWSRVNCDRNASKPATDLKTRIRIKLGSDLSGPPVSLTNELPPELPLAWSDHWGATNVWWVSVTESAVTRVPQKCPHCDTFEPLLVAATLEALTASSPRREEYSFRKA